MSDKPSTHFTSITTDWVRWAGKVISKFIWVESGGFALSGVISSTSLDGLHVSIRQAFQCNKFQVSRLASTTLPRSIRCRLILGHPNQNHFRFDGKSIRCFRALWQIAFLSVVVGQNFSQLVDFPIHFDSVGTLIKALIWRETCLRWKLLIGRIDGHCSPVLRNRGSEWVCAWKKPDTSSVFRSINSLVNCATIGWDFRERDARERRTEERSTKAFK